MSYFAKVVDGIVTEVLVAEQDFIDTQEGTWVQTYYDGSTRKNYAGTGFTYDSTKDAFIPPQPHSSWTLNETTCKWEAPVTKPDDDKFYTWNEATTNWIEVE
jgi:hypothetical protein|tara:strand:+ start:1811 stop:2116 length:306 start_codon:yes stop_codon:yes gene_type:complete